MGGRALTTTLPLGALPVAWWVFWFAAALFLYLGLVWLLIRRATAADAENPHGASLSPNKPKGEHS